MRVLEALQALPTLSDIGSVGIGFVASFLISILLVGIDQALAWFAIHELYRWHSEVSHDAYPSNRGVPILLGLVLV